MTSFGILSTYPPTQCGLATFSSALAEHLELAGDGTEVVSVVDAYRPGGPANVRYQWVRERPEQVAEVAAVLDAADVVVVQHEFGIFGGRDGRDVLEVVRRLRAPFLVVLHTVLVAPSEEQRAIVEELAARAYAIVTMSRAARDRLLRSVDVDPTRVHVVPHGAAPGLAGPTTVPSEGAFRLLTWGLIGPGKGIEWAIDALAECRDLDLEYDIVGLTHPKVAERTGERYREGLMARAEALGVRDRVRFVGRYLEPRELHRIVRSTDAVLVPYESREQVTSGVLVEAVAARRPVISTDFPHARELLAGQVGLVVPTRDPGAISRAIRRLVTEPALTRAMSDRCAVVAPSLMWPAVTEQYRRIASEAIARRSLAS
jgi:glycosyltransferase involved in cell wall biosynthesis